MSDFALFDGQQCDVAPRFHRGLVFGDGLFETLRARKGAIPLWAAHCVRMRESCQRLGLDMPDASVLDAERDTLLGLCPDATLRLVLWRESGGVSYDPGPVRRCHRLWNILQPFPAEIAPLRLRWCELRLASQPRTAGLKTLNRLEQVLARGEWSSDEWDEGLLCDQSDRAIGGIAANLFVRIDGQLTTPALGRAGVAGVMRGWILAHAGAGAGERVTVRDILRAEFDRAEEMFLTNAVRGIRPVGELAGRTLEIGLATMRLIEAARTAGVMDSNEDVTACAD